MQVRIECDDGKFRERFGVMDILPQVGDCIWHDGFEYRIRKRGYHQEHGPEKAVVCLLVIKRINQ